MAPPDTSKPPLIPSKSAFGPITGVVNISASGIASLKGDRLASELESVERFLDGPVSTSVSFHGDARDIAKATKVFGNHIARAQKKAETARKPKARKRRDSGK